MTVSDGFRPTHKGIYNIHNRYFRGVVRARVAITPQQSVVALHRSQLRCSLHCASSVLCGNTAVPTSRAALCGNTGCAPLGNTLNLTPAALLPPGLTSRCLSSEDYHRELYFYGRHQR